MAVSQFLLVHGHGRVRPNLWRCASKLAWWVRPAHGRSGDFANERRVVVVRCLHQLGLINAKAPSPQAPSTSQASLRNSKPAAGCRSAPFVRALPLRRGRGRSRGVAAASTTAPKQAGRAQVLDQDGGGRGWLHGHVPRNAGCRRHHRQVTNGSIPTTPLSDSIQCSASASPEPVEVLGRRPLPPPPLCRAAALLDAPSSFPPPARPACHSCASARPRIVVSARRGCRSSPVSVRRAEKLGHLSARARPPACPPPSRLALPRED